MASKSSDFVLDEGLDDDEDMLALHSQQLADPTTTEPPSSSTDAPPESSSATASSSTSQPKPVAAQSSDQPITASHHQEEEPSANAEPLLTEAETKATIIDGLPLSSSRADLNALLPDASAITHIRLRRLESHGLLRVLVEFSSREAAEAARTLDGTDFRGHALSVKTGTAERWAAAAPRTQANTGWSFGALAERMEESARRLGEELEGRLKVSEKVADTKAALQRVDQQYGVSARVGEMARAGRDTAAGIDRTYGISDGVGRVVGEVGGAARVVASEVDENFRIGDKARQATNAALKNETLAPVAKTLVGGGGGGGSRKNYQPRAPDPEQEEAASELPEASNNVEVGE